MSPTIAPEKKAQAIALLMAAKHTLTEVAKEAGVSESTVRRIASRNGLTPYVDKTKHGRIGGEASVRAMAQAFPVKKIREVVARHREGMPMREIAATTKTSPVGVRLALGKLGILPLPGTEVCKALEDVYLRGMTPKEAAKNYPQINTERLKICSSYRMQHIALHQYAEEEGLTLVSSPWDDLVLGGHRPPPSNRVEERGAEDFIQESLKYLQKKDDTESEQEEPAPPVQEEPPPIVETASVIVPPDLRWEPITKKLNVRSPVVAAGAIRQAMVDGLRYDVVETEKKPCLPYFYLPFLYDRQDDDRGVLVTSGFWWWIYEEQEGVVWRYGAPSLKGVHRLYVNGQEAYGGFDPEHQEFIIRAWLETAKELR